MRVRDIMTRNVECIRPEATLREAAAKMKLLDIGPLPVSNGKRLLGLITDRDIVVRAIAAGMDAVATKVEDIMTPGVVGCFEDQLVQEAARIMEDKQVRRLVVLDHDNQLAGILSLGDLALCTHDEQLTGEALEAISAPG